MFVVRVYDIYGFEIAKCLGNHTTLDNCIKAVKGYFSKPRRGYTSEEIELLPWDRHPWGVEYTARLNLKGDFSGYHIQAKVIGEEQ